MKRFFAALALVLAAACLPTYKPVPYVYPTPPAIASSAPSYQPITSPLTACSVIFCRDGQPWRWQSISAYEAMRLYDQGGEAALAPYVAYTHAIGAKGWRVFLQHFYMDWPAINPYIAPIEKVRPLADYLARAGLDVEFTILADAQADALNQSLDWQTQRVAAVIHAVAGAPNVTLELCNEPFANGCDPYAIADRLNLWDQANRPVLMALGDYSIVGHESTFLWLDYITDHPERKSTWAFEAAKTGHFITTGWPADAQSPGFRGARVPIVEDEPVHVGTDDPSYETNVDHVREGFAGFAVGMAGATFHSTDGIFARVPVAGSVTDTLGRAAMQAMAFPPADTALCPYWHDGIAGGPLQSVTDPSVVGEVAGRVCTSTAYVVVAGPSSGYQPQPAPGWTLQSRTGALDDLLVLTTR